MSKIGPIQLATNKTGKLLIDIKNLRDFLLQDEIKNRKVCAISICGTYREGKSFLLNFLLRYLRLRYKENRQLGAKWLQEKDGNISGFRFISGQNPCTTGINLWNEYFLAETFKGEKIVILLLDTQGSFDNKSTTDDCARIFAFSTVFSSVQIFNLSKKINQYDLDHLQTFAGYGGFHMESNVKLFQNLCFLIRDWSSPDDYPYGDGKNYISKCHASLNDRLESFFIDIDCFLLPYPGNKVATSKAFTGKLNEIEDDFKIHVQNFVHKLLDLDNLVLKSFNGEETTAENLFSYIEGFNEAITNCKDGLKVTGVHEAMLSLNFDKICEKTLKWFKNKLDGSIAYLLTTSDLDKTYLDVSKESQKKFREDIKFKDPRFIETYSEKLKKASYDHYQKQSRFYRLQVEQTLRQIENKKAQYKSHVKRIQDQALQINSSLNDEVSHWTDVSVLDEAYDEFKIRAVDQFQAEINNRATFNRLFGIFSTKLSSIKNTVDKEYFDELKKLLHNRYICYRDQVIANDRTKTTYTVLGYMGATVCTLATAGAAGAFISGVGLGASTLSTIGSSAAMTTVFDNLSKSYSGAKPKRRGASQRSKTTRR